MSHIQEYKVVWETSLHELQDKVNNYIKNGWELSGNLLVDHHDCFLQPMIKLKPKLEFDKGKYID